MSAPPDKSMPFSLVRGIALRQLLWRDRGVEASAGMVRRVVLTTLVCWPPLLVLCLFEGTAYGTATAMPLFGDAEACARLLVAVPLFLLAEPFVDRRTSGAIRSIEASRVIDPAARPAWDAALQRTAALGESRAAGVVILLWVLATMILRVSSPELDGDPLASSWARPEQGAGLSWAGCWSELVARPVARFLAFRWLWRGVLWLLFLARIARIDLRPLPTHPDQCGGLGSLARAQSSFTLVGIAFGAALSGSVGNEILYEAEVVDHVRLTVAAFVGIVLAVMFGPLLMFTPRLIASQERGLLRHGRLGAALAAKFEARWTEASDDEQETLIEKVDPSAVADYSAAYETVATMRCFLVSVRTLGVVIVALAAPFAPLVFLAMPVHEVFNRLLASLM